MSEAQVQNPNRLMIYVCAQLLRVHSDGSTNWAYDYQCAGPTFAPTVDWYTPGEYPDDGAGYLGTYVIQIGCWYNGSYYGNAASSLSCAGSAIGPYGEGVISGGGAFLDCHW